MQRMYYSELNDLHHLSPHQGGSFERELTKLYVSDFY